MNNYLFHVNIKILKARLTLKKMALQLQMQQSDI